MVPFSLVPGSRNILEVRHQLPIEESLNAVSLTNEVFLAPPIQGIKSLGR